MTVFSLYNYVSACAFFHTRIHTQKRSVRVSLKITAKKISLDHYKGKVLAKGGDCISVILVEKCCLVKVYFVLFSIQEGLWIIHQGLKHFDESKKAYDADNSLKYQFRLPFTSRSYGPRISIQLYLYNQHAIKE